MGPHREVRSRGSGRLDADNRVSVGAWPAALPSSVGIGIGLRTGIGAERENEGEGGRGGGREWAVGESGGENKRAIKVKVIG